MWWRLRCLASSRQDDREAGPALAALAERHPDRGDERSESLSEGSLGAGYCSSPSLSSRPRGRARASRRVEGSGGGVLLLPLSVIPTGGGERSEPPSGGIRGRVARSNLHCTDLPLSSRLCRSLRMTVRPGRPWRSWPNVIPTEAMSEASR